MLEELLGERVVVDCRSEYVALGTLKRTDAEWLELKHADLHDLRDTESTREMYVAESVRTGVKRNRRRVLIQRREVIAVSKLDDVVDD